MTVIRVNGVSRDRRGSRPRTFDGDSQTRGKPQPASERRQRILSQTENRAAGFDLRESHTAAVARPCSQLFHTLPWTDNRANWDYVSEREDR